MFQITLAYRNIFVVMDGVGTYNALHAESFVQSHLLTIDHNTAFWLPINPYFHEPMHSLSAIPFHCYTYPINVHVCSVSVIKQCELGSNVQIRARNDHIRPILAEYTTFCGYKIPGDWVWTKYDPENIHMFLLSIVCYWMYENWVIQRLLCVVFMFVCCD